MNTFTKTAAGAVLGGSLLTWATYQEGSAARWVRADVDAVLAPYLPAKTHAKTTAKAPAKKKAPRRGSAPAG